MLGFGAKIFSSFRDLYNELNPATLTGAIDVIVVEQPDGSLVGTPFYVRFGKMGVLRSREKVVDVTLNDEPIDLYLKLDDSGEAYFVEDTVVEREVPIELAASPLPTSAAALMAKGLANLHKASDETKLDVKSRSISPKPARREVQPVVKKLSNLEFNTIKQTMSMDDECGTRLQKPKRKISKYAKRGSLKRRFARLRSCSWHSGLGGDLVIGTATTSTDKKANETAELFAEQRKQKIRTKLGKLKLTDDNSNKTDEATTVDRQMSGAWATPVEDLPSPPKFKLGPTGQEDIFHMEFSDEDNNSDEPSSGKVRDLEKQRTISVDIDKQFLDCVSDVYSMTSMVSPGNTNEVSKSDPSKETTKWSNVEQTQQAKSVSDAQQSSRWGISNMLGLGFMRRSTPSSGTTSNMQPNKMEGIYLDDLLKSDKNEIDPELAALYLENSQKNRKMRHSTENVHTNGVGFTPREVSSPEDDGYGSNPSSVVSDDYSRRLSRHLDKSKNGTLLEYSVSRCDKEENKRKTLVVVDEEFENKKLTYDDFVKNPELLFSHELIIRVNGKYYDYRVAVPILISSIMFQQPLTNNVVKSLCSKYDVSNELPFKSAPVIIQPQSVSHGSWFTWRRAASAQPEEVVKPTLDERPLTPHIDVESSKASVSSSSPSNDDREALSDGELDQPCNETATTSSRYRKTLHLTSDQLKKLNLKPDVGNRMTFSVTTKYQGTTTCECTVYLWKWDDKVVISDIDGTITRSDVLGHIMPIVGRQWEHANVTELFTHIAENGYKVMYLTARAIGQSQRTKDYLKNIKQGDLALPDGPLQLSPSSLFSAFHREVIEKKPEVFKIKCLRDIRSIFPATVNPYYAGFGNRTNDELAYKTSGVPINRIFTINPSGEVRFLDRRFRSSYQHISEIIDHIFPPVYYKTVDERRKSLFSAADNFSNYTYWRQPMSETKIDLEKFRNVDKNELQSKSPSRRLYYYRTRNASSSN